VTLKSKILENFTIKFFSHKIWLSFEGFDQKVAFDEGLESI
jgi:hypothetical protein